ncbi:MAG: hypothetical protein GY808_14355 [Gammaproteobacteria bacterium]|nr:hypothetical protein [Gammaproteobacteria bacterium]
MMKASSPGVDGTLIDIDKLSANQLAEMYALMKSYYVNLVEEKFIRDLHEKDQVILLTEQKNGDICGFSTQVSFSLCNTEAPVRILFSGDTIIDQHYWHSNPLARLWGLIAMKMLEEHPDHDLYWLLMSKGFRTYRYLPVFFKQFYPCYNKATPDSILNLVEAIINYKDLTNFDKDTSILYANEYFLQPDFADIEQGRLNNPHIHFFLDRNPGYVQGDELCCIAKISTDNFRRSAYRVMGKKHP